MDSDRRTVGRISIYQDIVLDLSSHVKEKPAVTGVS